MFFYFIQIGENGENQHFFRFKILSFRKYISAYPQCNTDAVNPVEHGWKLLLLINSWKLSFYITFKRKMYIFCGNEQKQSSCCIKNQFYLGNYVAILNKWRKMAYLNRLFLNNWFSTSLWEHKMNKKCHTWLTINAQ